MTPSPSPVHQRIISRRLRRRDLMTKLDILQRGRCPLGWVIDPDDASARIWDLVDGAYVLTHHVTAHEPVRVTHRGADLPGL